MNYMLKCPCCRSDITVSVSIFNHQETSDHVLMAKLSGILSRCPSMNEGVIKNRFRRVQHMPRILSDMVNMGFLGFSEKQHPKSKSVIRTYYLKRPFSY